MSTTRPRISAKPAEAIPESSDPMTRVGQSFKAATASVRRLRGRETQRLGHLSHAQYSLLFGLADQPQLSASKLAASAEVSPATVTQMLDHLESDGLVARTRSDQDKRVVFVSLTARGRAEIEARRARYEPRWREALSGFSDEELLGAAAVLDRLSEMFDEFERED